jgi:hypothetical protein
MAKDRRGSEKKERFSIYTVAGFPLAGLFKSFVTKTFYFLVLQYFGKNEIFMSAEQNFPETKWRKRGLFLLNLAKFCRHEMDQ